MDKDLGGDIVKVDHVREDKPDAQESCRRERREQAQLGGRARALREARAEVLLYFMTLCSRHPGRGSHCYTHFTEWKTEALKGEGT